MKDQRVQASQFKEISRFPGIQRDLAVVVDENIKAGDLIQHIRTLGGNLIHCIEVFDVFKGGHLPKEKKSLGFRIHYRSEEATLVSERVNDVHFKIVESLGAMYGAKLPSSSAHA
jgi:phenylalanyl-tRNA synthetase beta chain